jgi:hypothetical protein
VTLLGEAKREAPAQTELSPTSIGSLVNQTTHNDRACALWMSGRNMV